MKYFKQKWKCISLQIQRQYRYITTGATAAVAAWHEIFFERFLDFPPFSSSFNFVILILLFGQKSYLYGFLRKLSSYVLGQVLSY